MAATVPIPPSPSGSTLTFNQTVRGITDFIEVAIHTILYVRQVYPAEIFIRRKKYDTPVFQSRHPALNAYISGAIKAVGEELVKGNLDKVVVVIKNKEEKALERFVFSVENMIEVEKFDKNTSVEGAMSSLALGQYFRSFLVKLNMIEAQLGQMYLGDDVSFAILMELKDGIKPSTTAGSKEPPPWIPADLKHTTSGASEDAELHVVRAVSTGIINLSLVVQESDIKLSLNPDAHTSGKTRTS
ncbi:spindle checkpoint protein [Lentinula raphanica]|nr:spindle checkpoint protein [Lentinula raphanica]